MWEDVTRISSTTKRLGEILHPLPSGCYLGALLLWLGSLGANRILFATRLLFIKTPVHHFSVYTFFTLSWRKELWRRIHLPSLVSGSHLWLQRFTSVVFFFRLLLGVIDVMIINHLLWLICVVLQWSHRMSCDIRRHCGTGTWSSCETILKHIILIRLFTLHLKQIFSKIFLLFSRQKCFCQRTGVVLCLCSLWEAVVLAGQCRGITGFQLCVKMKPVEVVLFVFSFLFYFLLSLDFLYCTSIHTVVFHASYPKHFLLLSPVFTAKILGFSFPRQLKLCPIFCVFGRWSRPNTWLGGVVTHLGEPLERLLCPLWHQKGLIPTAVCVLAHTFRKVEQAAKVKERRFSFPDSLKRGWNLKFH